MIHQELGEEKASGEQLSGRHTDTRKLTKICEELLEISRLLSYLDISCGNSCGSAPICFKRYIEDLWRVCSRVRVKEDLAFSIT